MARGATFRWPGGWARVAPARAEPHVAALTLASHGPPPTPVVGRCLDRLRGAGYRRVVTNALSPGEADPLARAGFTVRERLHLLARPCTGVPGVPDRPVRRARRGDPLLEIDAAAFGPAAFAPDDLDAARRATSTARVRVAASAGYPAGYAISGRTGGNGYLQRLAVRSTHRRSGYGRALVLDALRALARAGTTTVYVNTTWGNEPALALYRGLGFSDEPGGLCTLERAL